jgi:hypothetical protein
MTILFLHGLQSTPGGLKPTQAHGHEVLPDDDFDAALKIAQAEYDQPLDQQDAGGELRDGRQRQNRDAVNWTSCPVGPAVAKIG